MTRMPLSRPFAAASLVALAALAVGARPALAAKAVQSAGARPILTTSTAATPIETRPLSQLSQLSRSVEALVTRVSPSVVQVLVTGYGPVADSGRDDADVVIGRQRSLGSGVVIDPDGFIVTNAHVVAGAQRVQVVIPPAAGDGESPLRSLVSARGRTVEARIVGTADEVDLALLKVELTDLPALKMANYDTLRQGQMVFAFGSPEGLRNSVTMGVVSAVARQPDADHPMVYIQTDAPINHGNSGGPLVNVDGDVVGINAFILSESGGSQGLGFAIPSAVVSAAYPQLQKYGHLHRGGVGMNVQTITPDLAHGLGLTKDFGLVVSDLMPGGPAEAAGVRVQDVIESIDGVPMDSLLQLAFHFYTRHQGDTVTFGVLRGDEHVTMSVAVIERAHDTDRLGDLVDPEKNSIRQLGVVGVTVDAAVLQIVPNLRVPSGVIVAARAGDSHVADVSLSTGDVVHRVNGQTIGGLRDLRTAMEALPPRTAAVLQIERDGQLMFVAFQMD